MPIVPGLLSPYEAVRGFVYLPRLVSKIRLHAAGQLHADFVNNLGKAFDDRCCQYLGIKYDDLRVWVLQNPAATQDEVLAWAEAKGRKLSTNDIEIWNGFMTKRGWRDEANEVLGYMDRITLPYHPRVVVFQCGGNDINSGDEPSAPIARIREYLARLRKENPDCAVVFIATTRAPSRKAKWEQLDEYNRQLQLLVKEGKNLWYVDINAALNLPNGEGKPGSYLKDNLHPDVAGYKAIAAVLRPAVDAAWQATEAAFKK
jgi:lysophospholipase L1-like esterase